MKNKNKTQLFHWTLYKNLLTQSLLKMVNILEEPVGWTYNKNLLTQSLLKLVNIYRRRQWIW